MRRRPAGYVPTLPRGERGIAMIMALMVLLAMSLLAVLLMVSLQVETKIAGHSARYASALNIAEAGVGEALARIRNGDIPNTLNPRTVGQIFLANAGSIPPVGADTIAMGTGQPAGQWLDYSTANKTGDVLTVRYKTDAARTIIYRYDQNLVSPINYWTGFPIWVVTARGKKGNDIRRIETEVVARPYNVSVNAAMAAKKGIEFSGNAEVCGYNHRMDTPSYTSGVHGAPLGPNGPCVAWEVGNTDLPGSWSEEPISSGGSAEQGGTPMKNSANNGAGFYSGPWDALGLTMPEFFTWIGLPLSVPPATPNGVFYLDNNATYQDQSGVFAYNGANGEGLLYVDGDLTVNGNFTFRGLIYIEGDLKINGNSWILGALVVKGKGPIKIANGSCVVLWSRDSVQQNITKYGQQFLTLAWREIP